MLQDWHQRDPLRSSWRHTPLTGCNTGTLWATSKTLSRIRPPKSPSLILTMSWSIKAAEMRCASWTDVRTGLLSSVHVMQEVYARNKTLLCVHSFQQDVSWKSQLELAVDVSAEHKYCGQFDPEWCQVVDKTSGLLQYLFNSFLDILNTLHHVVH